MIKWLCRDSDNCRTELEEFLSNLIEELKFRLESSVTQGLTVLADSVDLAKLIQCTAGKWCSILNEPILIDAINLDSFNKFYAHVLSLPNLKEMESDAAFVIKRVVNALK